MVLFKTLIFTILVPGTVTVIVPWALVSKYPARLPVELALLRYGGGILIVVGAIIYLRCAWDFSTAGYGTPAPIAPPEKLVVRGFYRFTRNPMYVGVTTVLIGEFVLTSSLVQFAYAWIVFVIVRTFVVYYEEPNLRRRFGEPYERYCATVPRWFPNFWKKHAG